MADFIYNRFKANLFNKILDLEADVIKCALMATGHSASTVADNVWTDVSGNEMSGTGYTAGGATLASKAVTQAATTSWDAADTAWTTATFSAYYAVLYDDTAATDDLICSFDFAGVKTVTAGTFTIQWNASGIITLA
ncbi:MAG: hypothetical protein GY774_10630 [Planctomycetes bacterium]|nr:hypothetical protein [Planctomycetota bacterium]